MNLPVEIAHLPPASALKRLICNVRFFYNMGDLSVDPNISNLAGRQLAPQHRALSSGTGMCAMLMAGLAVTNFALLIEHALAVVYQFHSF